MQFTQCPHCGLKHSLRETGQCPRCRKSVQEASAPLDSPPPAASTPSDIDPGDVYDGPSPGDVYDGPDPADVYDGGEPSDVYDGPDPGDVYDGPQDVYQGPEPGSHQDQEHGSDAGVYRAPAAAYQPSASQSPADDGVPLAAKIAGIIIALLSIMNVATGSTGGVLDNPSTGITSLLIDLVLAGMLLTNNVKALLWTKIRVILGGIAFTVIFIATEQPVEAVVNVVLVGALLSLLLGRPGPIRTALGSLACASIVGLAGIGLLLSSSGLLSKAAIATGALQEVPADRVIARDDWNYTVSVPEGDWYELDRDQAIKQNPLADVWLTRPSVDAHVIIIPERLEQGQFVSLKDFAAVVKDNARAATKELEIRGERSMRAANRMAHLLHTRAKVDGMKLEYYYGLVVYRERIYQVVCFSSQKNFDEVDQDFLKIIQSFELSDAASD